jgi:2-oxoglutarate ferredoxin oxidoreductase subunit alpha
MTIAGPSVQAVPGRVAPAIVNDFSINVATVNGSGSQTANLVLLRALFQSGVPVSAKNVFPSNIAGLPTWFIIRASRRGYAARKKDADILVALNAETAREDVLALPPGAVAIYDEPLGLHGLRDDVVFYPVPFDRLVAGVCPDARLRRLVRNMVYDGVLSRLLGIELAQVESALARQLASKPRALAVNQAALVAGFEFAGSALAKRDPFVVEPLKGTAGCILVDGNTAAAIGAMMAGVTVVTWYPITPSSSIGDALGRYLRKYRSDPETGKSTFAVVQAEDELSALGMALGAGWLGARSMTATSGPGLSLMSEFTGFGYFAEIPTVIVDVQRLGPSTGLPTRTAQGDILAAAFLSHGDTRHPMFLPASPSEVYEMTIDAFDLAERLQTPVFVMSDLDIGMNTWMSDPFRYPEKPLDRGRRLTPEKLSELGDWGRYRDVEGDGIPYRTVPGDGLPPYFCRGSGHTERAQYSERPADYVATVERLNRKFGQARALMPPPVVDRVEPARVGIVGYGSSHWGIVESRDQLREEAGLETSYLRLRAFPFGEGVEAFIAAHDRVYVVDQNRDAQMAALLKLDVDAALTPRLRSVLHCDGQPLDARTITDGILIQEGGPAGKAAAPMPATREAEVRP